MRISGLPNWRGFGPVQTRQARRLETALDSARHPGPTSRQRRRRSLPWSWDSDTESDTDPRLSCGGAVGTQVDSSDVPSEVLDAMERDCEASLSGPHNADVTAPGRSMLVSTQVESNDQFASPEPEIMVGLPFSPMISHNPD